MCGICGFVSFKGSPFNGHSVIKKMTDIISHRGPDDEGFYIDKENKIFLGMRRLKIIDIEGGHQPISNEDDTIHVIFNGEIYNYRKLRGELEKRGHIFKTRSDTEVIVHLYEEYGEHFVSELNGMFAIALFDSMQRKLLIVRDRMGIKPLFYYLDSGKLAFASEIKSILCFPGISREINPESMIDFLSLYYVIAPSTLFKGINQLMPGEIGIISTEDGRFLKRTYWKINIEPDDLLSEREILGDIETIMSDSVKSHLISDVPVGIALSGGMDSSSLLAIATDYLDHKPLKTFSACFDEPSHNEIKWARKVSDFLEAENYEIKVGPDSLRHLPRLVWHMEEPTADPSAMNLYLVSKAAYHEVKVLLTGDGADEIFAGYDTYIAQNYLNTWNKVPQSLRRGIAYLIERLPEKNKKYGIEMLLKRFIRASGKTREEAHFMWRTIFYEKERAAILKKDFFLSNAITDYNPFIKCKRYFDDVSEADFLNQMLYVDSAFYLPNDMLTRTDRATMAASIEARVPFLDYRLVEYLFRVPSKIKLKNNVKKHLLKAVMRNKLPEEIIRRKKQGFNLPVGYWFRKKKPKELINLIQLLGQDVPFLNLAPILKIVDDHIAGRCDNGYKIWCILVLMIWYHNFFLSKDISAPLDIQL